MNRFTTKSKENNFTNNDYEIITEVPGDELDMQQYANNKLGLIENIEEEIGIKICDFYKLTQSDKIYLPRFKAYYKVSAIDVKTWEILVYNNKKIPCAYTLKIKNYGKTWLFKKGEEL